MLATYVLFVLDLMSMSLEQQHLMLLTEKDLLSYDEETQKFKTTERGLWFLQIYSQIEDMIKAPQQPKQLPM